MNVRVPIVAMLVLAAMPAAGAADQRRPSGPSAPRADTNAIETLTPDQARGLVAGFKGVEVTIAVGGPREGVDGPASRAVGLPLDGLKTIDAETAAALAAFPGTSLHLRGLTVLPADCGRALATFKGRYLLLDGLTTLPADTAAALAAFKGNALHLDGLTVLDAEAATALAAFAGLRLELDGLTAIDAETAVALARFGGASLHLNGLEQIDADAAAALARSACLRLDVGGIARRTALDTPESVAVLRLLSAPCVTADGRLHLPALARLSPAVAEALVAMDQWSGDLPGLTAFEAADSVAVAKALAARKGALRLPHLKKISPKTLSALIEKEDIDIPLIETLELIPEPDGAATDDFVIPERFQERQRRQDR
jgi:hypothetical protein